MSCLDWERSDQRSDHQLSRLGALRFSRLAQTMSFLDWEREDSDHELSRLGPLTISFLDLSQLGALRPRVVSTGSAHTSAQTMS